MTGKINWKATSAEGSRNDCVVRAFADAFGLEYENANGIAMQFGRRPNEGMYYHQYMPMFRLMAMRQKKAFRKVPHEVWMPMGKTPITFMRSCGKGVYFLDTKRHVLTVVDGKTKDWASNTKVRILVVHTLEAL